ncbi:peptidoglycan/LPS O-acetylase OafA/YrhL [Curtobacterium herbarum]|uniref:acyltransferase family protein n=1 Tax=Curtobacterium herbarum TaxID=150122 RepID=UPI00209ED86E|nr:acyltransferase family protein [Curtobacterium herbarum]MCP1501280.1 peptidoglycan/LPS O-acetylase OafA/YrhL [Curtobacterium herbarum]
MPQPVIQAARRADIQGVRALAVGLVVVHHVTGSPKGGFIGVDVFFVISGFLITGLLLRERQQTGRISLREFYGRRVRRLMPVALTVLVVSLLTVSIVLPAQRLASAAADAAWSALFLANWHFAAESTDYFASDGPTSPFQHFWSLSVEEQFYVVIPALLMGALAVGSVATGRRVALVTVTVITAASFGWALVSSSIDPSGAYFSTTVRAWELGAGALLAFALPRLQRLPVDVGSALSWVGTAGILLAAFVVDDTDGFPAPWALLPVAATLAVLAGGAPSAARTPTLLTMRPMTFLGDVSYSLYLWHFPVLVVLTSIAPDAVWLTIPMSLALAVMSYQTIEQPFLTAPWSSMRRPGFRRAWTRWSVELRRALLRNGVAAVAVVSVMLTVAAAEHLRPVAVPDSVLASGSEDVLPDADGDDGSAAGATEEQYGPAVTALQTQISDALGATSWPELSEDPAGEINGGRHSLCSDTEKPLSIEACTFGPRDAAHTMMLVGDSTAAHELDALIEIVESPGSEWKLVGRAGFACSFMDTEIRSELLDACRSYKQVTLDTIAATHPDLLVVTNSFADLPLQGTNRDMTTAEWRSGLERYMEQVTPSVGQVVHVTPPPAGKSIEECYREGGSPAACITRVSSQWTGRLAAVQGLDGDPAVVDTRPLFCVQSSCPAFVGDTLVKEDLVHLTGAYAVEMAPGLHELLLDAGTLEGA